jgi:hypothetical protein
MSIAYDFRSSELRDYLNSTFKITGWSKFQQKIPHILKMNKNKNQYN